MKQQFFLTSFKKSQTSVEVISLLSIVLLIAVIYLVVTGQVSFFASQTKTDSARFFEVAEIGIQELAIGSISTIRLSNNLPLDITIKEIRGSASQEVLFTYNSSFDFLLGSSVSLVLDSVSCIPSTFYEVSLEITYSAIGVPGNKTLIYPSAYPLYCN